MFRDFDDYWTPFLSGVGPAPGYAPRSTAARPRRAPRARSDATLPREPDGSIALTARAWAVPRSTAQVEGGPTQPHKAGRPAHVSNGRILAGCALTIALVLVTGLAVVTALIPPQTRGPLALVQVVVLHLVLAALIVGGIVAIVVRTRVAGLALLVLALVAGLRFGSELGSLPADPGPGDRLAIASWNLELGARRGGRGRRTDPRPRCRRGVAPGA